MREAIFKYQIPAKRIPTKKNKKSTQKSSKYFLEVHLKGNKRYEQLLKFEESVRVNKKKKIIIQLMKKLARRPNWLGVDSKFTKVSSSRLDVYELSNILYEFCPS